MQYVWVVMGQQEADDEGDGEMEWFVAAYPEEELAKQHADLANNYADEACSTKEKLEETEADGVLETWERQKSPFDKASENSEMDMASYYVRKVSFCLHVDNYQERANW